MYWVTIAANYRVCVEAFIQGGPKVWIKIIIFSISNLKKATEIPEMILN